MLPARHRLRASADFASAVRGRGASRCGGRLVVVHVNHSPTRTGLPARVGFVVSKAVGDAVTRNRTKRVLRHLVADRMSSVPQGYDVVVRAQGAAGRASTRELGVELDRVVPVAVRKMRVSQPSEMPQARADLPARDLPPHEVLP